MTGSEQGGAFVGMSAISFIFIGIVLVLIAGVASLIFWTFHWSFLLPGGIFLAVGCLCFAYMNYVERRRSA